jgi:lipopolysaccharide/colanic/teichoic acid biosynthesis glycosyltransferase
MLKRIFDLTSSVIGLLLLLPVFIIIGVLIRKDGGAAFFRQERVGRNGKPFRIFKFRSMTVDAESQGAQITAGPDPRITRIGAFIRKSKIDELAQLINVFLGQMSIVGPRPEVPRYAEKWQQEDRDIILSVRPGVTDYASFIYSNEQEVLGASDDPGKTYVEEVMPHKLALYRQYVRDRSFWLDLRIILATVLRLVGFNVSLLLPEIEKEILEIQLSDKINHESTK